MMIFLSKFSASFLTRLYTLNNNQTSLLTHSEHLKFKCSVVKVSLSVSINMLEHFKSFPLKFLHRKFTKFPTELPGYCVLYFQIKPMTLYPRYYFSTNKLTSLIFYIKDTSCYIHHVAIILSA